MDEDCFTDGMHLRASVDELAIKRILEEDGVDETAPIASGESATKAPVTKSTVKAQPQDTAKNRRRSVRKSVLNRQTSQSYPNASEQETVLKVLTQITSIETRLQNKGFKQDRFTLGVMNCLFMAYTLGAFPQHFWLVYLAESCFFIPTKFRNMIRAKPLSEALYYLDFCWMMNISGVVLLLTLLFFSDNLSEDWRKQVFMGMFGITCGPLLGATAVLPFVALLFHDVNTMTNFVIHALPPMLFYTLQWHGEDIRQAWPEVFKLVHELDEDEAPFFGDQNGAGAGSVARNTLMIYMMWFLPYVGWMLLLGLDLPRKDLHKSRPPRYDTVFHSFWRSGYCATIGGRLWNRPVAVSKRQMETDHYEWRDFALYMAIHLIMCVSSIPLLAYPCYTSKFMHGALLTGVVLICVYRGSLRYTYYTTNMFGKLIRKEFLD